MLILLLILRVAIQEFLRIINRNTRYSYAIIEQKLDTLKEFNNKRKAELKSMYKKLDNWEDPDPESEDDLSEEELKAGSKIDVEDTNGDNQWYSSTVVCNLGNMIKVSKEENDEMEVDGRVTKVTEQWINKDSSEIAPYQTKSRSVRASMLGVYMHAYKNS